jgi:hypothetical protein
MTKGTGRDDLGNWKLGLAKVWEGEYYKGSVFVQEERIMGSDKKMAPQRERDAASVELLRKLRGELLSDDITTSRLAGFNLSWKQEDGLAILKEALFGDYPRTAKKAAAYGLRSMKGRMQKMALEVLEQGLRHRDRTTKAACVKSLSLMKGGGAAKPRSGQARPKG